MAELSIFIDESGDSCEYEAHSPLYLMTLAFHDQSKGITTIINAVFNVLVDAEIRRVKPSDHCLFQVADLFCTLELAKLKLDSQGLSKSEDEFFRGPRAFKRTTGSRLRESGFSSTLRTCRRSA